MIHGVVQIFDYTYSSRGSGGVFARPATIDMNEWVMLEMAVCCIEIRGRVPVLLLLLLELEALTLILLLNFVSSIVSIVGLKTGRFPEV